MHPKGKMLAAARRAEAMDLFSASPITTAARVLTPTWASVA